MAQIVLKIPTNSSGSSWIEGVCDIAGYETYLPVESASYSITGDFDEVRRRPSGPPTVSEMTITRKVDLNTTDITKAMLYGTVNSAPWELCFFRSIGGGPVQEDTYVTRHLLYLTLSMANPLVTSQKFDLDEGKLTETLAVSASAFEWVYTSYDADNDPVGNIVFDFDVQAQTEDTTDC